MFMTICPLLLLAEGLLALLPSTNWNHQTFQHLQRPIRLQYHNIICRFPSVGLTYEYQDDNCTSENKQNFRYHKEPKLSGKHR
ncbi:hypothetical protein M378DRAFT_821655 [Amanita muscaria Koide BX008]|uniref:Secreted protein n=1 Tax=Amanita muscaria (strain Koide BX008) TaxID=946122 RepID=A0A0C2WE47_AMAMK|nr:hypothetical protein M378DRAFT_821655 [Amanita muscaria Koide BX008]